MDIFSLGGVTVALWLISGLWFALRNDLTKGRLILSAVVVPFWPIPYQIIEALISLILLVIGGILGSIFVVFVWVFVLPLWAVAMFWLISNVVYPVVVGTIEFILTRP